MSILVPIALFGWLPVVMLMYSMMPPRRAAILATALAWMFLPVAGYKVEGVPPYDKMNATNLAVFLGALIFDQGRFRCLKLSWFDVPMLGYCLLPFISLRAMALPFASSVYWSLDQTIAWGLPYLVGRLYIRHLEDVCELARLLVICGLIYVPFCLYEIRMSPELHRIVYGFTQHAWGQTKRGDGWRPMVFMQHGLMVATWMTSITVLGFWGWRRRTLKRIWGLRAGVVVSLLLWTAFWCKSTGATVLMIVSIVALSLARLTGRSWVIMLLIAAPAIYVSSRVIGAWDGKWLVAAAAEISEGRSVSLRSRLDSEQNFIGHALKRPLVGWGPGPQATPPMEERVAKKATWDALWIINFTKFGTMGLLAWLLVGALPGALFLSAFRGAAREHPGVSAGMALVVALSCYQIDCLSNAMIQPVFVLGFGGITGVATERLAALSQARLARRTHVNSGTQRILAHVSARWRPACNEK